jgi:hypothetical protein
MSFTRWFIYGSFASGVLALSLQSSGIGHASSPIFKVADQSSGSSQDRLREFRSGMTGTANAESSGKMQSEKDSLPGGGNMNPNSRVEGRPSQGQGSEVAPGSPNPRVSGSSPSFGNSSMGSGSGTGGAGIGGGSR